MSAAKPAPLPGRLATAALVLALLPVGTLPAQNASPAMGPAASPAPAPLFNDLGSYHRQISSPVAAAQRYFDQGLRLLFAFNLEEAERSFREAVKRDPHCGICEWGVAMSLSPHLNVPGMPDRTQAAHQAALRAAALTAGANPVEQGLIAAIGRRSTDPPPGTLEAQAKLDADYAAAMQELRGRFPRDPDVAALAAEAAMDVHPWDYWTLEGKPEPWTAAIVTTLQAVLHSDPNHPGANHYLIHLLEASPHPELALDAAERVARLEPGAGHLVHMPSHIFARVGRYEDAAVANRKAIAVDHAYIDRVHPQGFYVMYAAHNHQFLAFAAMMEGRSAEAIAEARRATGMLAPEFLKEMPGFDYGLELPLWTLVRFGHDSEVLAEPPPPADFAYATAIWHAARGIAFAHTARLDQALAEQKAVSSLAKAIPADAPQGFNTSRGLLALVEPLLRGEIAAAKGDARTAVGQLQEAVKAGDALRYDEPPDWYYSLRPRLAELLLGAHRPAEAEAVSREDLRRNAENGWSLDALAESLRAQSKTSAGVQARLAKAWSHADVETRSGRSSQR